MKEIKEMKELQSLFSMDTEYEKCDLRQDDNAFASLSNLILKNVRRNKTTNADKAFSLMSRSLRSSFLDAVNYRISLLPTFTEPREDKLVTLTRHIDRLCENSNINSLLCLDEKTPYTSSHVNQLSNLSPIFKMHDEMSESLYNDREDGLENLSRTSKRDSSLEDNLYHREEKVEESIGTAVFLEDDDINVQGDNKHRSKHYSKRNKNKIKQRKHERQNRKPSVSDMEQNDEIFIKKSRSTGPSTISSSSSSSSDFSSRVNPKAYRRNKRGVCNDLADELFRDLNSIRSRYAACDEAQCIEKQSKIRKQLLEEMQCVMKMYNRTNDSELKHICQRYMLDLQDNLRKWSYIPSSETLISSPTRSAHVPMQQETNYSIATQTQTAPLHAQESHQMYSSHTPIFDSRTAPSSLSRTMGTQHPPVGTSSKFSTMSPTKYSTMSPIEEDYSSSVLSSFEKQLTDDCETFETRSSKNKTVSEGGKTKSSSSRRSNLEGEKSKSSSSKKSNSSSRSKNKTSKVTKRRSSDGHTSYIIQLGSNDSCDEEVILSFESNEKDEISEGSKPIENSPDETLIIKNSCSDENKKNEHAMTEVMKDIKQNLNEKLERMIQKFEIFEEPTGLFQNYLKKVVEQEVKEETEPLETSKESSISRVRSKESTKSRQTSKGARTSVEAATNSPKNNIIVEQTPNSVSSISSKRISSEVSFSPGASSGMNGNLSPTLSPSDGRSFHRGKKHLMSPTDGRSVEKHKRPFMSPTDARSLKSNHITPKSHKSTYREQLKEMMGKDIMLISRSSSGESNVFFSYTPILDKYSPSSDSVNNVSRTQHQRQRKEIMKELSLPKSSEEDPTNYHLLEELSSLNESPKNMVGETKEGKHFLYEDGESHKQEEGMRAVKVEAPETLPEYFSFEAKLGNDTFWVTVPPGGVQKGEIFTSHVHDSTLPYANNENNKIVENTPYRDSGITTTLAQNVEPHVPMKVVNADNNQYVPPITSSKLVTSPQNKFIQMDVPHGYWRDGLFDCFIDGPDHPMLLNSCFCPQFALAQIMSRMNIDCWGRKALSFDSKIKIRNVFLISFLLTLFNVVVVYFVIRIYYVHGGAWYRQSITEALALTLPVLVLDLAAGTFFFMLLIKTRRLIRTNYNIPQTCCKCYPDAAPSLCCTTCTISQMGRHTAEYRTYRAVCCSDTGLPLHVETLPFPDDDTTGELTV